MDALVLKNTEEYEIEAVEADWDHPHPAVLGKIVNKTKKTLCFEFDDNPDNCLLVEPGQLDMLAYDNYMNYQWSFIVDNNYKVSTIERGANWIKFL